jgi:hypothetical protein
VIVNDFNVLSVCGLPNETDPPLIVDSNTVLPGALALESFQPVTRYAADFLQVGSGIKDAKFAASNAIESLGTSLTSGRYSVTQ